MTSPDNIVYSHCSTYSFADNDWLQKLNSIDLEGTKLSNLPFASILISILCLQIFTGSDSNLNTVLSIIATVIICTKLT